MTKLPKDIETLHGLWVLFELPKLPKEEQKKNRNKAERSQV